MADVLIKTKDRADRQCESEIMGAKDFNLREIETFRKVGVWKKNPMIRAVIVDDSGPHKSWRGAFPIFKSDGIEDILKKYWDVFKWEAVMVMEGIKDASELQDDRGFSRSGDRKYVCTIPETLNSVLKEYFPQFYKSKRGIASLKKLMPKYFI